MSYQPPQQPPERPMSEEERTKKVMEEILGGQIPGADYLFAADPETRMKNMIQTTPDVVRMQLLRAIEVAAANSVMPFGMEKKAELGKMALEMAQAYLLLDPSVDNEGVSVAEKIALQAQTSHEKTALDAHAKAAAGHLETRANAPFERPATESGHQEPPRVKLNPAAQKVRGKNKPKSEILKGARGDKPTPQPRVGS